MEYNLREDPSSDTALRFARYAKMVWGVDGAFYDPLQAAMEGVFRLKNFLSSIGLPVSFAGANLGKDQIPGMSKEAVKFGPLGNFRKLDAGAVEAIFRIAAEA